MPQKKGPKGPLIPPVEMADRDGSYLIFPGKLCRVCQVQLTSRNRAWATLLCRMHSRTEARVKYGAKPRESSQAAPLVPQNPARQELHSLLDRFMNDATDSYRLDVLNSKLVDYGIHALMRYR